jgi:hypothetical protein
MRLVSMDLVLLFELALFAVGIAYVVTGSTIGYLARVAGYAVLHRLPIHAHKVFFCPPCCSFWCGAGLALWVGCPWQNILQVAFTACLFGIVVQQQWVIAANDEPEIAKIFERRSDG